MLSARISAHIIMPGVKLTLEKMTEPKLASGDPQVSSHMKYKSYGVKF